MRSSDWVGLEPFVTEVTSTPIVPKDYEMSVTVLVCTFHDDSSAYAPSALIVWVVPSDTISDHIAGNLTLVTA